MKKNKITGLIGTAVLHILAPYPAAGDCYPPSAGSGRGGCSCYAGKYRAFSGNADPYTLTDMDVINEPEAPAPDVSEPETDPPVEAKDGNHRADEEETVAVPKKESLKQKPLKKKNPRRKLLKRTYRKRRR